MSLDMGSTVPRKIGDLARAFAVHADADAEETAAMMAQVRPRLTPLSHPRAFLRGVWRQSAHGFRTIPFAETGGHTDTATAAPPK